MRRRERVLADAQGRALAAMTRLPAGLQRLLAGPPLERDGQRLELETRLLLRMMAASGQRALAELDVGAARRQVAGNCRAVRGPRPRLASVEPITITGGETELRGRLFVPAGGDSPSGLLVYFHGGGFVVCDLDTHGHTCALLAAAAGVHVLAVDYRLAPEHRFPTAAEDAWSAYRFAAGHAAALGADPNRMAVGGDSAGGNLAAGVAQRARGEDIPPPAFQLLIYPWLDLSAKGRSYELFREGFYLSEGDLDWYRSHYLSDPGDALDPRCSPALAGDLAAVAPAYVAVAGFDPLRDEGIDYARRLRQAGVRAALVRHPSVVHGFANTLGVGRLGREAMLAAAGALRFALC